MCAQLSVHVRVNSTKTRISHRQSNKSLAMKRGRVSDESAPDASRAAPSRLLRCLSLRYLWSLLFLALNCIHVFPGLAGHIEFAQLGRDSTYRIESVTTVSNPPPPPRG